MGGLFPGPIQPKAVIRPKNPVLIVPSIPGGGDKLPSIRNSPAQAGGDRGERTRQGMSALGTEKSKETASALGFIAVDSSSRAAMELARKVAASEVSVLLTGPSGVGKEVLARYLHDLSARRYGPFVAVNCAAIPEALLETTLFGHEKGAFTGALRAQVGKFELASRGTLLLDEISELPLALQAKLLRVLQERVVERVGGHEPVDLDLRIIATSNRDLAGEVAAGRFREDLYYRIAVFPIALAPLAERRDDILPLARALLRRHAAAAGRTLPELSMEAEAVLVAHHWPGNVRELENAVQRALVLCEGVAIQPQHLGLGAKPADHVEVMAAPGGWQGGNVKGVEKALILSTLAAVKGSRKAAVAKLGISERTLRYRLQQYRAEGIDPDACFGVASRAMA